MSNADSIRDLDAENTGPLKGVKIIDLSAVVFGPYGSQILGDLGADVIKVEGITGDNIRWAGECTTRQMGPIYMNYNRNKRSISLDLKLPESKKALLELLKDADLFFSNVRMAGLERLGFAYEEVKKVNPSIIYLHCAGFGQDGPYADLMAYDDVIQAASGFSDLLPRTDNGLPRYIPSLIADKTAGLHAAYAAIAALYHKEKTGKGQFVSVPMYEAFTFFNMSEAMYGHTFEPGKEDVGYPRSMDPNRRPYKTRDGYIAVVPYEGNHWHIFFGFVGKEHLLDDPRFDSFKNRTKNISLLYGMVEEITVTKTTDEWIKLLNEVRIPCMRVNRLDEVMDDRHLEAVGFFEKMKHPTEGDYYSMKHPVEFSESPATVRRYPPKVGQHTEELLRDLDLDETEIERILARPE